MGRRDGVRARLGSSSSPARSSSHSVSVKSFFLTDPSTTASYALSLHDALPISDAGLPVQCGGITVVPGDILVGDSDGVMVIPRAMAAKVADEAVHHDELEVYLFERISGGESLRGIYPPNEQTLRDYEVWKQKR